jgi:hypothetical protein
MKRCRSAEYGSIAIISHFSILLRVNISIEIAHALDSAPVQWRPFLDFYL